MNSTLEGEVTLIYVRAGISKKGRPYLCVANGRSELYIDLPEGHDIDQYEEFSDGDMISLNVKVTVGSDRVTLV